MANTTACGLIATAAALRRVAVRLFHAAVLGVALGMAYAWLMKVIR